MAEPAPLSPEELDRIEDALEDLELADALDDPSPRVREHLAAYREILIATRTELPLEEVPQGLLAGVLAAAHESAVAPTPVAGPQEPERRESAWQRFRRSFLVPTLALAGTAALVLWFVRPDPSAVGIDAGDDLARGPTTREIPSKGADASEPAQPPASIAPTPAGSPADAAVTEKPAEEEVPRLDNLGEAGNAAAADDEAPKIPGQTTAAPVVAPDEPKADLKKGAAADIPSGWSLIESGDSSRKAGDCRSAREDYITAAEDDDPRVRARAFVGLGLCDSAAGNNGDAESNFEKARGLDSTVDAIIEREHEKPYRSSTKSRKSAPAKKSKPKASMTPNDPMGL